VDQADRVPSRQAKAVLLEGEELHTAITASGVDTQETAERLLRKVVRQSGIDRREIGCVVGTGYGRVALRLDDIPSEVVTEISCHALAEDDHPRLRLMVSGGVMADGDRRIMDLLEDHLGCRVVVEDHCTGLGPFYHDTPETDDPWQDLADAYLDQAPCARQAPLSRRVDFSAQLATDYPVDGVVYSYLMFCPGCGLSKHSFIKRFQELFLPVLELPSNYSQGDTGQIKTRLDAFVEVLQENKRGAACP
jgi:hypothetical protein